MNRLEILMRLNPDEQEFMFARLRVVDFDTALVELCKAKAILGDDEPQWLKDLKAKAAA